MFLKRFLCKLYDLDTSPTNIIQSHCIPFDQRHQVTEVKARLEQRERKCVPDKDFSYSSAMTFKSDLENDLWSLHTFYSKALFT